jgi:hypothetical protein
MTQAIVDDLESIEVEKHHCEDSLRMAFDATYGADQLMIELAAIGQPGQVIVMRDVI